MVEETKTVFDKQSAAVNECESEDEQDVQGELLKQFRAEDVQKYRDSLIETIRFRQEFPKEGLKSAYQVREELKQAEKILEGNPSYFYNVLNKIGVGGFATLFRVMRLSDGQLLAMKYIEPKNNTETDQAKNKIAIRNLCKGDHTVKIYETYYYEYRLWIVQELMHGGSLTEIVQERHNSYSEEFCKYSLWAVCKALIECHRQNIIYRAVKSDNVLCKPNGDLKLTGFDYSVKLSQQQQKASERCGAVCWMAPELIEGKAPYDFKVDCWSLGVLAMELAEGDPPYINLRHQSLIIQKIVFQEMPKLASKRWSPDFQDFINKCLTKQVDLRWSADMLIHHPFLAGAENLREQWCADFALWQQTKEQEHSIY